MKKLNSFLLCVTVLCACNSNEPKEQLQTLEQEETMSVRRNDPPKEQKKIDWALVAIADGGGAELGALLASKSGNPYVIIASAAGVGAYYSYDEYERQKAEIDRVDAIWQPDAINPDFPFQPDPLVKDHSYCIKNEAYKNLGEEHNRIVLETYAKYAETSSKSPCRAPSNATLVTQQKYGAFKIDSRELFHQTLHNALDAKGLKLDVNSVYGMSESDLFDAVSKKNIKRKNQEQDLSLDEDSELFTHLSQYPIEKTLDYINSRAKVSKEETSSELSFLSVAYYSKCLWNTMAPDPIIAQECIVWRPKSHDLKYIYGRSQVKDAIESGKYGYILYPAYGKEGIIALYMYTAPSQYGQSKFIENIKVQSDLFVASKYFNTNIRIPKGYYNVEHTNCDNV